MKNKGLISLLIFNLIIHLFVYNRFPLQFDELLTFNLVRDLNLMGLIKFLFINEVQMPLQYVLIKLISLVSMDISWLRIPTFLMTLVLPYIVYKNAKFTLSESDALKASSLVSISYPILFYSHSLRPYTLLILAFSCCMYFLRLSLTACEKQNKKVPCFLLTSLILLFLSHPIGALSSVVIAAAYLLSKRNDRLTIITYSSLCLITISCLSIFLRKDIIEKFNFDIKVIELMMSFIYKLSFISSGIIFSFIVLGLIIYSFQKKLLRQLDLFNLMWFVIPIVACLSLIPFFGTFLYPRHIIFILPAFIFLVMELISKIEIPRLRNVLYGLSLVSLMGKSFVQEKVHLIPPELESDKMASKMLELSDNKFSMISCGNCLSYYIKSDLLFCISKGYDYKKLSHIKGKFVYLELDFVKKHCGLQHFDKRIKTLEVHSFKGGTVYFMDRSPLHDKQHLDLPSKGRITADP